MSERKLRFNPPPGWPKPPAGWVPPRGWTPDPKWPAPPTGWQLWVSDVELSAEVQAPVAPQSPVPTTSQPDAPRLTTVGAEIHQSALTNDRIAELQEEVDALRRRLATAESRGNSAQAVVLDDELVLQDVGIYRYRHPLESAIAYRARLDEITARIAEIVKAGSAIEVSDMFTFDGSLAKGRAMSRDLSKLMLRAYNAEAENIVRSMRAGNVRTAVSRLEASRTSIAKLGAMMQMRVSEVFHALRVEEIELTADYQMKKEQEREEAREAREQLREQRKVEMELAEAREKLEKERSHLLGVINKLASKGEADEALQSKLAEVDAAIAQNDYRAANIRAGYVYVISNRGAFGANVVKIGLTRRLEPLDRIQELGDASVPFRFDVHALYFSEDAVTLEGELHAHFASRRLNWANNRKEFFFASPAEVREVLAAKLGNLLEFQEHAESLEYLQSARYWPAIDEAFRGPAPLA